MKTGRIYFKVIIFLVVVFSYNVYAARCRHCGREYGKSRRGDEARVYQLRRQHEESCPARSKYKPVYIDKVTKNLQITRSTFDEAAARLKEINDIAKTFPGWAKSVLESLPASERKSLEKAMAGITQRFRSAVSHYRELNVKLQNMERELFELQDKIVKTGRENIRFTGEIKTAGQRVDSIKYKIKNIENELAVASSALQHLEDISSRQSENVKKASDEYWQTIGDFFRDKTLGSPRDYITPVKAGPANTMRRVRIIKERVEVKVVYPASAVSVKSVTVPNFGNAFAVAAKPVQEQVVIAHLEASPRNLKRRINQLQKKTGECDRLTKRVGKRLIELDRAKWQFKQSLKAQREYEENRNVLTDKIDELKNDLDWCLWELDIRTSKARAYILHSYQDWKKGQRWKALKRLFNLTIRNREISDMAHNNIKFAYDLINGGLSKVPKAIASSNSKEIQDIIDQIEATFDSFAKKTLRIRDDPFKEKIKWIKGLIKSVEGVDK